MKIDSVAARAIKDTRGRPTVEVTLTCEEFTATASVPSGKSTGSQEAVELRDADGGVMQAVENVKEEILHALVGHDFSSADEIDTLLIELDGTVNKSRLGANALLPVSMATMRLFALVNGVPLWQEIATRAGTSPSAPRLFMNAINGGVHTDFKLPFQEYIVVIEGKTRDAYRIAQDAFKKLGEKLGDVPMGDEGGYAPTFSRLEEPFEILSTLVEEFPNTSIAIDAAASELFSDGRYNILGKLYSAEELFVVYQNLVTKFPLHSIEDPFDEKDMNDFVGLTKALDGKTLIVGDDFTCTNPKLISNAISNKALNAVLIKPNQIGTVMEAITAVRDTQAAGYDAIASHRSGETNDTFIADFAYGVGAFGIKAGGLGQQERLEKYERLLEIEQEAQTV